MKKKLFRKIFKKEIEAYEKEIGWLKEVIRVAGEEEEEHGKMLQLYEEELIFLERQNELLTFIIESFKLYEK